MPLMQRSIFLAHRITLPEPWDAVLLRVSGFPIPEDERAVVSSLIGRVATLLTNGRSLSAETFLQVEQLDDKNCRRVYAQSAPSWIPEVGLGVWPDRDPPSIWTRDEFMNAVPGEKLRPLMYQIVRITSSLQMKLQAFSAMLPYGPVLQILTADDPETFLEKATLLLLPAISDPSFTCYPFYVPLLDGKSLCSATYEQLHTWSCGASVYIRESFEDKGILIVSHEPLSPTFDQIGGRFEPEPKPLWRIPC